MWRLCIKCIKNVCMHSLMMMMMNFLMMMMTTTMTMTTDKNAKLHGHGGYLLAGDGRET